MSASYRKVFGLLLVWAEALANVWSSDNNTVPYRQVVTESCPEDVPQPKFFRGSVCYEFVSNELTWVNARLYCQQRSRFSPGSLVTITDAATQNWLMARMSGIGWTSRYGVWLGLNDRANESIFVWDHPDGIEGPQFTYHNWGTHEPNSFHGSNCVYMNPTYEWKWFAVPCNVLFFRTYKFICQYPATKENVTATNDYRTTQHTITDDFRRSTITEMNSSIITSSVADEASMQTKGSVIPTEAYHSTVQSSLSTDQRCPTDILMPAVVYRGTCNYFVSNVTTWVQARNYCHLQSQISPGRLVSVPDEDTHNWLVAEVNRLGWTRSNGVWLGLNDRAIEGEFVWDEYAGQDTPAKFMNWYPNEPNNLFNEDCVFMSDDYDWKWLDAECNSSRFRRYSFVCQYQILENSTILSTTFPNSSDELVTSHSTMPLLLTTDTINYTTSQFDMQEAINTTHLLRDERCPADIAEPLAVYRGSCIQFVSSEKSWVEAQQYCRRHSQVSFGHLISVTDDNMQNWLVTQMLRLGWTNRYGIWLGLNDRAREDFFVWDQHDGEGLPVTYTNWMTNEPGDAFNQDCVFMSPANEWKWFDAECSFWLLRSYFFICQYPFVGDPASSMIWTRMPLTNLSNQPTPAASRSSSVLVNNTQDYTTVNNFNQRAETSQDDSSNPTNTIILERGTTTAYFQSETSIISHETSSASPLTTGSNFTYQHLIRPLHSNVFCPDQRSHNYQGLDEKSAGYLVGEEIVDINCTAEHTLVTWRCSNSSEVGAQWIAVKNESCPSRSTTIARLEQANMTHSSVSAILREAIDIMSSYAVGHQSLNLTVEDVTFASQIVTNVISLLALQPPNISTHSVVDSALTLVSLLLEASSDSVTTKISSEKSITQNLDELVHVASSNLQENSTITFLQPNLVVQMTSDPDVIGVEIVGDGHLNNNTMKLVRAGSNGSQAEADIVATLSPKTKNLRKSFIVFNNSKLFHGRKMRPAIERMISVQLSENIMQPDLVTLLFKLPSTQSQTSKYEDFECGFWNNTESDWSSFGCKKLPVSNHVACSCDPTTVLALLKIAQDMVEVQEGRGFSLATVTRVGLSLSVVLLLAVVMSILLLRKLRRKASQKAILGLTVSIGLLDALFLIGVERKESMAACVAIAAIIHIFLLSSFAWISVIASLLYFRLISNSTADPSFFFVKTSLPAWGLPGLAVGAFLIADYRLYDTSLDGICWMKGIPMHYGVLLPILLLVAYNAIIYILIARAFLSSKSLLVISPAMHYQSLKLQSWRDFSVFVLTGLAWTFGYFAVYETEGVYQYLFCLFSTVQGIVIAVLHFKLGELLPKKLGKLLWRTGLTEQSNDLSQMDSFNSEFNNPIYQGDDTTRP